MKKRVILSLCMAFGLTATVAHAAPTVTARSVATPPTLDGKAGDWAGITPVTVKVNPAQPGDAKNYSGTIDVQIRAAVNGDTIYWLIQWPDDTKDDTHKTLIWNKEEEAYETGKDREDRLALTFAMGGDYQSCMLAGTEYKADVWHWKAFRSATAGLAHDKMHIVSYKQLPKAKKHPGRNGKEVWVARPSDAGDKLYKSQRPIDFIGDRVPKYLVNKNATGSIADVKAAATWENNTWTLELARKLNTGHDDDIVFERGGTYKAAVAVFNHTGDDHHSTAGFTLVIE